MADVNTNQNPAGLEGNENGTGSGNDNLDNITLPTTVEELTALLQREADIRVASALKTREESLKADFQIKLESERAEATRLAKLSTAEREKAEFEKEKNRFEAERKEFLKTQMLNQTMLELQKEDLPVSFAEYLLGEDAEKTLEKINAFKGVWQESLQTAIDGRLKGNSPKTGSDVSTITTEQFNKMGYKEKVDLMNTNSQLYAELLKKK